MEPVDQLLLEPLLKDNAYSRRSFIPGWMKVFIWIFMIIGALVPFCLMAGILGINVKLVLFGLESRDTLSKVGLAILLILLFKGFVSFGLWTEKEWAIRAGLVDAVISFGICIYVMVLEPLMFKQPGSAISFQPDIIMLFPYIIELSKLKSQWLRN